MPIEPGKDPDAPASLKEQANKQNLLAGLFANAKKTLNDTINRNKTLNDIRIGGLIGLVNRVRALLSLSKAYQKQLKVGRDERVKRRQRMRRSQVQPDDPALIEATKQTLDALSMLTKEPEKESPVLPKLAEGKPEEKQKTLVFSKMASFFKKAISTKPTLNSGKERKNRPN